MSGNAAWFVLEDAVVEVIVVVTRRVTGTKETHDEMKKIISTQEYQTKKGDSSLYEGKVLLLMMMDMEERKRKADEEMVINTPIPLAWRGLGGLFTQLLEEGPTC